LIANDGGVRTREVELLVVTVIPPDEIRWLSILMTNLEDGAVTGLLARPMSADQNPITNSCVHDAPNLLTALPQ
jgi:hypothetical protein